MNSRQKRKPEDVAATATGRSQSAARPKKAPGASEQFWQHEIKAMLGSSYESIDAAVTALSERVSDRLGIQGAERAAQCAFLKDLVATDPSIQDELRRLLQIKN